MRATLLALALTGCASAAPRTSAQGAGSDDEVPPRPPPPAVVHGETTACATDADCAIAPEDTCTCPPCGYVWRRALRTDVVRAMDEESRRVDGVYGVERCELPCAPCQATTPAGGWVLGTRAVCSAGTCEIE